MLRPPWPRTLQPARLGVVLSAVFLALLLLTKDVGAEPGIEVLQAGWDGAVVSGTWTPVRLRVTGTDRDERALIEVIPEMAYSPTPMGAVTRYPIGSYGKMISLPAAGTREVTIWFPGDQEPATARLSVNGRVLAEQELLLKMARPGWPLIAVASDAPVMSRALKSIELPYQGLPLPLAVADVGMGSLPDDPDRLRAISALIVQGNSASQATESQRAAVLDWLHGGGHLVIAGGTGVDAALKILPDGTLPLSLRPGGPVSTEALSPWLTNTTGLPAFSPALRFQYTGGDVLAGTPETPLVWRTSIGQGSVTMLAFDPTLEPLASWPGLPGLLRQTIEEALPLNIDEIGARGPSVYPSPSLRLQDVTGMLPRDAHPDWALIGALLAGFALVVGPGLYLLLRHTQRRGLVWVAVPATALVFAAAIYTWGVEGRGRDLIVNSASYVELGRTAGEPARQSVAAAFYGPTFERLTVEVPVDGSVRAMSQGGYGPFGPFGPGSEVPDEPPFRVVEGGNRHVEFIAGQYGQRAVMFERTLENAPRVTADITLDNGLLVGTLRNDSPYRLDNAAVIIGSSVVKLGTLAPGQSAPVQLQPDSNAMSFVFKGQPLSHLVFGQEVTDTGGMRGLPPGYFELPTNVEIQRRAQMLDTMLQGEPQRYMPGPTPLPLTFVAYTNDLPVLRDLLSEQHPTYELTLLRQPLELRLDPGPFVMPSGLLPGELVESSTPFGVGGGGNGTLMWIELRGGSVTYAFRPSLGKNARIDTIVLQTEQIGTTTPVTSPPGVPPGVPVPVPPPSVPGGPPSFAQGPAEAGVFSAYDWQQGTWTPMPAGSQHRLEGARFAGPSGEVRVRVQSADIVRFLVPSVTLEGRVEGGAR